MKACCSDLIRGLICLAGLRKPRSISFWICEIRDSDYDDGCLLVYDAVFSGRGLPTFPRNVVLPFQSRSLREYAFPKPLLVSTRLCGITSKKMVLLAQ